VVDKNFDSYDHSFDFASVSCFVVPAGHGGWSKSGSVSLATITALKRNKESDKWFEEKELDFKLAA